MPPSPEAILTILLNAENRLTDAPWNDIFYLCEVLRETAEQFAPRTAAFYLCRYEADNDVLNFVYNYDSGVYDKPDSFALGDGPTSNVIRTGAPFRFRDSEEASEADDDAAQVVRETQHGAVNFGDVRLVSRAALHLPLWQSATTNESASRGARFVIGVLSAQSYQADAYDSAVCRAALDWLANRAGAILGQWSAQEQAGVALRDAQTRITAAEMRTSELSQRFKQTLAGLNRDADALRAQIPASLPDLRRAADALRRACSRAQTETSQTGSVPVNRVKRRDENKAAPLSATPLHVGSETETKAAAATTANENVSGPLGALSERERDIVLLIAEGLTYSEVADRLFISVNTVKHHLVSTRRKLNASNRHELAVRVIEAHDQT